MKYPKPNETPCVKGKHHSIRMLKGTCRHCEKRFWPEDRKMLKKLENLSVRVSKLFDELRDI